MTQHSRPRSSFNRLLSNSGWNLLGQGGGLLVALGAIPILLNQLGPASFGLFTVFLALISYSGLLDLGIGRAVTAEVARHALLSSRKVVSDSVNAALALLAILGFILSILLVALSNQIAELLVGDATWLVSDCNDALFVLSLTVPVVLLASGIRGALEGLQEFKAIAKVTMPTGILIFAVPAGLSTYTTSISHLMWSLLMVRIFALVMLYVTCKRRTYKMSLRWPSGREARALLTAGGWMTISNIVSPIMNSLDRLFISIQLSPASAAIYVTPYELATKALLPAGSIANATFPEFAAHATAQTQVDERRRYFWRATLLTSATALVPSFLLAVFAQEILTEWISKEFAAGVSTDILRLLAVGITANAAAYIPFAYIQSIGRADITAKFHLAELILFIPALFYSLQEFGVIGAAMIWVGRVIIDAILLFSFALHRMK